ncbi:hypothetical protein AV530_006426 [Patagioenas fasciata monilis]|uniref:Uncharacterized protein n=1 Tax=Patagioenas fasciata monilis TaxID=372326 RepID=A0A1V4KGU1_PATFA|nr:hypothetical protein AV530_006426 [Patagioenas fasciata monilis]
MSFEKRYHYFGRRRVSVSPQPVPYKVPCTALCWGGSGKKNSPLPAGSNIHGYNIFSPNLTLRAFLQKPQLKTRDVAGKSGSSSDPPFQLPAQTEHRYSEHISKYS